ncbi:carbohydrate-binding protein [Kibdelosporangium aridum]|uniref:Glucosylceramidase n=1 Tax=Kibdelosporangium aridum TaxID=2030 RepID=A0A1W2FBA3_KIBAR|nr:carbohydrate-binding protein [Kibdelosporangium aridum]SMD19227.1 glucosylceramidase [Kibdelosporangium aridum]
MTSQTRWRRSPAVAATVVAMALVAPSAEAADDATWGSFVTGTYSAGSDNTWRQLPPVRIGRDSGAPADATVVIDPSQLRQRYTGIGFSIDETSVSNLWKLTPENRDKAIRLLADPKSGAGFDRFRLTIGSPDLIEHLPFWSYDELPPGVTEDWDLKYFSIQRDIDLHMVETVKMIQRYNPRATFIASAWSAPAWMKTNNRFIGEVALKQGSTNSYYQVGKLRDDAIDVFARYYVKYIQAYAKQGIKVDAITLLNEPGMDVVYPAMDIDIAQQQKLALAIKREFGKASLDTGLYMHDFNFWDWRDPNSTQTKNYYRVFEDSPDGTIKGKQVLDAADGLAFHPYWGDPKVMRDANAETGKSVHMTETSDLSPATVMNFFRLNAGSYITWAQATDQDGGTLHWTPARDNNIDWAEVGRTTKWPNRLVKVDTTARTFTVRNELFQLGQMAKYLGPEHTRVESSTTDNGVSNVVFKDRTDDFVAIIRNSNATQSSVRVKLADQSFVVKVPANAVATYRWHGKVPSDHRNHAPTIDPVADVTVDQFSTSQVQLRATDRDHRDKLSFYATELPDGVSIDSATGQVTLKPVATGTREVSVYVTDGKDRTEVKFKVNVRQKPAPVGQKVEAESYSAQNGWTEGGANFIENNAAASGGKNVGWTAAGNWLKFRIDVAQAGTYDLELRYANGSGSTAADALSFRNAAGEKLVTFSLPDSGGWGNWQSATAKVNLAAGEQEVTLFCEAGGYNLDYFRLS